MARRAGQTAIVNILAHRFLPQILRYVAVGLVVGVVTLILRPLQGYLGVQVIALIYLLPVILATFLWGLTAGVLAGLASFLLFNYFFLTPFHTLVVQQTQDLLTLAVFLVVAVVISQLIGQARAGVQLANRREWQATQMYTLISALAGLQDIPSVGKMLAQKTLETFNGQRIEVYIESPAKSNPLSIVAPPGSAKNGEPAVRCPMMTARRVEGELRLWIDRPALLDEETQLLNTFGSQGALAIERIRLSESETKARILEETDKAKSSLLSSVSHELRSPLAVIKASVSSLSNETVSWDSDARQDLLTTIEEEADHLNFLVGNLLDMSRIEAGALKPRRQWNALREIATGAIARLRTTLKDYRLELDFPAGLSLVPVDYFLIEQVFANLLSNSSKFAPTGSLITISVRPEQEIVHVRVSNQGPGVPEADLERIFDKFNRVTVSDRITGTGLGLSICKGIVEAHEGKIWAENAPGGFIFHFTLPQKMDGQVPQVPLDG